MTNDQIKNHETRSRACGATGEHWEFGFLISFVLRPSSFGFQSMPLYEYELCEGDCKVCGGKFVLRRSLSAAPLTQCPACKKPVRKVLSSFNSPRTLSISDAKKAGFTVLKRVSKGEYEKQ